MAKETEDEKRKAFLQEHLPYEIGMLRYTHARINELEPNRDWNAYFESYAVHARNLVQFLSRKRWKNSYKASDFSETYEQPIRKTSTASCRT